MKTVKQCTAAEFKAKHPEIVWVLQPEVAVLLSSLVHRILPVSILNDSDFPTSAPTSQALPRSAPRTAALSHSSFMIHWLNCFVVVDYFGTQEPPHLNYMLVVWHAVSATTSQQEGCRFDPEFGAFLFQATCSSCLSPPVQRHACEDSRLSVGGR